MPAQKRIGTRVGSMKALKTSLKRGQAGPVRYIPKNGSLTLRFLEEPDQWVNYWEHYDQVRRQSFPCVEDNCPGCNSDNRRTSRYLANALDVEKDTVIAVQLPKDLTNQLVRRYERYDTLMDRDYTLSRSGEGLDTVYDAEAEPAMKRKLTKYELRDLQDVLDEVYKSAMGEDDDEDDDDEDEKPARGSVTGRRQKTSAAKRLSNEVDDDDDEDEDDDEEEEDDEPAPRRGRKFNPPSRDEDDDDDDDDDDVEVDDDEDEDDEEDEDDGEEDLYTEEELKGMPPGTLRVLAKEYDLDVKGMKPPQIIKAILEAQEEPF